MSEASRVRFAEAARTEPADLGLACLLMGVEVDPLLDLRRSTAELDRLAAAVDRSLPPVEGLRRVLAGFTGDAQDYADLRSSLLHEVLARRAGLPILLSVVWMEVARRCGFAAYGVGLPGHYIARIGETHIDPFSGGASFDVKGVPAEYLRAWRGDETLLRILTNIRVWAGDAHDRLQTRRWAVDLSLRLPHHPAELRYERGVIRAASGDFLGAAGDFDVYADAVASIDPAAAERAKTEARAARARLN